MDKFKVVTDVCKWSLNYDYVIVVRMAILVATRSGSSNYWQLIVPVDRWQTYRICLFWLFYRRGPLMQRKRRSEIVMVVAGVNFERNSVVKWCFFYLMWEVSLESDSPRVVSFNPLTEVDSLFGLNVFLYGRFSWDV